MDHPQETRRRRIAAAAYIPVLFVLVSQSVLLLPLPAAGLVAVLLPFFHVGMTLVDGLANGLPHFGAAVFTAVVTELLRRERPAWTDLAAAHGRLREYAAQAG